MITAELIYHSWCMATVGRVLDWTRLSREAQARFIVQADYLNTQLDEQELHDEEERIEARAQHWHDRRAIERDYIEMPW